MPDMPDEFETEPEIALDQTETEDSQPRHKVADTELLDASDRTKDVKKFNDHCGDYQMNVSDGEEVQSEME